MKNPAFSYRVPFLNRAMRQVMRPIFRSLYSLFSVMHIRGMENVPSSGAYIVAFNHVSIYDVPFLLTFWPTELEAIGAVEIWQRPGQNIFVSLYHAIQLSRNRYDRKALEQGLSVLASGMPLLIAPEGGRTYRPGLRRAYAGIAYLAERAKVPVVPVGIIGATTDFLLRVLRLERPRIEMNIGKPLHLPPLPAKGKVRRRARQHNADRVMLAIAALLPPEYRGAYANFAPSPEEGLG